MRLPATLAPWRPWLDWFDPDLAGALGELLLRLHPLLGAFRMRAQSGQLEPEGIDDLRRRGSYERLLLSEWALADAAPEEFDRRAAGGEHLFLSPKLVARQVDALTVAVFDSGPAQLGAPRLLHVALWILLAQRAQAAKARFAWGVLGIPGELHEAASAEHLRALLDARAWRFRADAGHAGTAQARAALEQQWAQHLDALQPSPGERWSIGAPGPGHGLGHRVGIGAADAGGLAVAVSAARARREATLALPDPARATRLLRGTFVLARTPTLELDQHDGPTRVVRMAKRLSLKQAPVLAANGSSVAVRLLDEPAAYVLRLTGKLRGGNPALIRMPGPMLAAAIHSHQFGGVVPTASELYFWALRGFSNGARPSQLAWANDQARWWPLLRVQAPSSQAQLFVLADGKLWRWQAELQARRAQAGSGPYAEDVLAAVPLHDAWVDFLRVADGQIEIRSTRPGFTRTPMAWAPCSGQAQSGWLHAHRSGGLYRHTAAVELRAGGHGGDRAGVWQVLQWTNGGASANFELILPSEWKTIGVDAPPGGDPVLLAINPDRTQVLAIGADQRRVLYRSATRLTAGSVAANGETIALIDLDGRLVVLHERGASTTIYAGGNGDD